MTCPSRATLALFKRNGLHTDGTQTGDQKCRAKPLAIELVVYLFGQLVDSQL